MDTKRHDARKHKRDLRTPLNEEHVYILCYQRWVLARNQGYRWCFVPTKRERRNEAGKTKRSTETDVVTRVTVDRARDTLLPRKLCEHRRERTRWRVRYHDEMRYLYRTVNGQLERARDCRRVSMAQALRTTVHCGSRSDAVSDGQVRPRPRVHATRRTKN